MAVNMLLGGTMGGGIPLSANIIPSSLYGYNDYGTVVSEAPAICSVTGGVPPYTYLWTFVSGDSSHIGTPTLSSTYFVMPGFGTEVRVGLYKCVVTDSAATSVDTSNNVTVTLERL